MLIWCLAVVGTHAGQVKTTLSDLGATKIYLSKPFHYKLGFSVSGIGDFNADGLRDIAIGAPAYNPGGLEDDHDNGAVFLIFGDQLKNESNRVDLASKSFTSAVVMGQYGEKVGNCIAQVGDINVDGFDDVAFGSSEGRAGYVLFGQSNPRRLLHLADLQSDGLRVAHTGYTVESAGDFNGDFFPDVVFGNPESEKVAAKEKEYAIGNVSILFGQKEYPAEIDIIQPGETHVSKRGPAGARLGYSIAGGFNMNADGFSDLFFTLPGGGSDFQGRGVLVHGSNEVDEQWEYSFIVNHVNRFARHPGDLNGDGFPDLVLGKENSSFILWGGNYLEGTIDLAKTLDPRWGVTVKGAQSAYGVGDLDGNGYDDLAIALPHQKVNGNPLAGCVVFLLGREEWPETIDVDQILLGNFTAMDYVLVYGEEAFGAFGYSVAGVGDIQGDGFDDVVIGAPYEALPGDTTSQKAGMAFVIQGKSIFYTQQSQRSLFHPSLSLTRKNSRG